jgi:FG-GAP repeat
MRLAPPPLLAVLLTAPLGAAGCDKDVVTAFSLEVAVLGNGTPVPVTLEWDEGAETVQLEPDGAATFRARLTADQAVLVRGPSECRFPNRDAAIPLVTTEAATRVELVCPGALELDTLGASPPLRESRSNLTFELSYGALLAAPDPVVEVAPRPRYPGITATVNQAAVGDGGAAAQRLRTGSNLVELAHPGSGLSRTYTVVLQRAAAARELTRVAGASAAGRLGSGLAAEGDVVAVGEPGAGDGQVLVYRRNGATWTLEATLTPDAGAGVDSGFGSALALVGDTLVVGAPLDDTDTISDAGAAYVFQRQGGVWSKRRRLTALTAGSRYGAAVALGPGGLLAVGSPREIRGQGTVYVYTDLGDIATAVRSVLNAPFRDDGDEFGTAVAFTGAALIIGAPGEDGGTTTASADNSRLEAGAVYRYAFTTSWTATGYYKPPPTPVAGAQFGKLLAASSDGVVASWRVGTTGAIECYRADLSYRYAISTPSAIANLSTHGGRVAYGQANGAGGWRAVVSRLDAAGPTPLAPAFSGSGAVDGDGYAAALALHGDRLFVGAPQQGAGNQGAFYVFE